MPDIAIHPTELCQLDELSAHPRNYRSHPPRQLAHLDESLTQFGVYRNVVIARDGVILAGHGVVESARRKGLGVLPVVRLDLDSDSPSALKIVAGDNELARLAVDDEATLAALLTDVKEHGDLLGSGFDDDALTALLARVNPTPPEDFRDYDENLPTEYQCPSCGYEWSGKPS